MDADWWETESAIVLTGYSFKCTTRARTSVNLHQQPLRPVGRQQRLGPAGRHLGGDQGAEDRGEGDAAVGDDDVEAREVRVRADDRVAVRRHWADAEPGRFAAGAL